MIIKMTKKWFVQGICVNMARIMTEVNQKHACFITVLCKEEAVLDIGLKGGLVVEKHGKIKVIIKFLF